MEWETTPYNNLVASTQDFAKQFLLDQYEMPCAMCKRNRGTSFTQWGSDVCPSGGLNGYRGYIMTAKTHRSAHECVEKTEPAVARKMCSTAYMCEVGTYTTATVFTFDSTFGADSDWAHVAAAAQVGSGWAHVATLGDHAGVLERITDTGTATLTTQCKFNANTVTIVMDVLPRKNNLASTLTVSIGATVFAEVAIPGSSDSTITDAPITLSNGASSSLESMTTGADNTDLVWTTAWELAVTLSLADISATLALNFKHTSTCSAASDVAVDNMIVKNATCGTGRACLCFGNNKYALEGDRTHTSATNMVIVESYGTPGPGYTNEVEVTCAQCMLQQVDGAVYTRWGASGCPAGATKIYSGYIMGANSASASGGATYLCSTPLVQRDQYHTGNQGEDVYKVEYNHNGALDALASLNHFDAVCTVCQVNHLLLLRDL